MRVAIEPFDLLQGDWHRNGQIQFLAEFRYLRQNRHQYGVGILGRDLDELEHGLLCVEIVESQIVVAINLEALSNSNTIGTDILLGFLMRAGEGAGARKRPVRPKVNAIAWELPRDIFQDGKGLISRPAGKGARPDIIFPTVIAVRNVFFFRDAELCRKAAKT